MIHVFDTEIAKTYGLQEAILLQNVWYWVEHNRANDINYHDGRYWTYNSVSALSELFPYLSRKQVRKALDHLRDEGILLTGNYNTQQYDRTLWYTISDLGESICRKEHIHLPCGANGNAPEGKPIPYINTDINTYKDICRIDEKRANGSSESDEHGTDTKKVAEAYNRICTSMPKCTKLSDKRRKHIKARLKEFTMDEIELVFSKAEASDFLSGRSGTWKANFDWLTRSEDNMRKVLEGNYDNKRSGWEFGDI